MAGRAPASERVLVSIADACRMVAGRRSEVEAMLYEIDAVRVTPWGPRVYVPTLMAWAEGLPLPSSEPAVVMPDLPTTSLTGRRSRKRAQQ